MHIDDIRRRFAVMNNAYQNYSFSFFLDSMDKLELNKIDLWGGVSHFNAFDATNQYLSDFKKEIFRRNFQLVCYTPEILGYPFNIAAKQPELREKSIAYCIRNIQIASELEIPQMLVNPGWGLWDCSREEALNRSADSLHQISSKADEYGIRILLEHLTPESSNLLTCADAVKHMLQKVALPSLGIALDLGQMSVFGECIYDYFESNDGNVGIVHMMDGLPGRHLAFGDGILPLQDYYNKLLLYGYDGYITLEINDGCYGDSPHEALQQCLARLLEWEGVG